MRILQKCAEGPDLLFHSQGSSRKLAEFSAKIPKVFGCSLDEEVAAGALFKKGVAACHISMFATERNA